MPVIIIAMKQKAIAHHLLVLTAQNHKVPRRNGQILPFIRKRVDRGIHMTQLLPFILKKFLLHQVIPAFFCNMFSFYCPTFFRDAAS